MTREIGFDVFTKQKANRTGACLLERGERKMTDKEKLRQILEQGDHISLECIAAEKGIPEGLWETCSAFANTHGGIILLGASENEETAIQDRFSITGLADPQQRMEEFWKKVNAGRLNRNLFSSKDVQILDVDETSVLMIHVPQAAPEQKPVFLHGDCRKWTFRRTYEGNVHCYEADLQVMFRDGAGASCDGLFMENSTMEDIDEKALEGYRNEFRVKNLNHPWNKLSDQAFLQNLGCYGRNRETGKEGLTLAGLLLFGKGLAIRDYFPYFSLDYQDLSSPGNPYGSDRRIQSDGSWEHNLYTFVRMVLPGLTGKLPKPFQMQGIIRKDETDLHQCVREALINTILHADFQRDQTLKIVQYEHEYLFVNPGGLKLPVSSILNGEKTRARNQTMERAFRMIGFCPESGHGMPMIVEAWKSRGWKKPELHDSPNQQTAELRLWMGASEKEEYEENLRRWCGKLYDYLSDEEKRILCLVCEERKVSLFRLVPFLHTNPQEIPERLNRLQNLNLLKRTGIGKASFWQLNDQFSEGAFARAQRAALDLTSEKILLLFAQHPELTNRDIMEEISTINTVQSAVYAMKKLMEEGLVLSEKRGRTTVYSLKS